MLVFGVRFSYILLNCLLVIVFKAIMDRDSTWRRSLLMH